MRKVIHNENDGIRITETENGYNISSFPGIRLCYSDSQEEIDRTTKHIIDMICATVV